jgi:rhodanese-related sulfurtransferase
VFEELDPVEVSDRWRKRPDAVVLLDVREAYERRVASIDPSLHIPMQEVPQRLAEIPRDKELIIYCHTGTRSMMVAGFLAGQGWKSVANLSGGIDAWSRRVNPRVPRYG